MGSSWKISWPLSQALARTGSSWLTTVALVRVEVTSSWSGGQQPVGGRAVDLDRHGRVGAAGLVVQHRHVALVKHDPHLAGQALDAEHRAGGHHQLVAGRHRERPQRVLGDRELGPAAVQPQPTSAALVFHLQHGGAVERSPRAVGQLDDPPLALGGAIDVGQAGPPGDPAGRPP